MGLNGVINDSSYKPGFEQFFLLFLTNMFILGWLGGLAVNEINQTFMQLSTLYYFSYFLTIIVLFALIEKKVFLLINKKLYFLAVVKNTNQLAINGAKNFTLDKPTISNAS